MQGVETARKESAAQKCRVGNCRKRKQRQNVAGVENARHEYSGKAEYRKPLLRNGILPGAKFTLRPPSLALSYWQRYCTAVEQWAWAKLCGVDHRAPPIYGRATIMLAIGPHSSWCFFSLQCRVMPCRKHAEIVVFMRNLTFLFVSLLCLCITRQCAVSQQQHWNLLKSY